MYTIEKMNTPKGLVELEHPVVADVNGDNRFEYYNNDGELRARYTEELGEAQIIDFEIIYDITFNNGTEKEYKKHNLIHKERDNFSLSACPLEKSDLYATHVNITINEVNV